MALKNFNYDRHVHAGIVQLGLRSLLAVISVPDESRIGTASGRVSSANRILAKKALRRLKKCKYRNREGY